MKLVLDTASPLNQGVLNYLGRGEKAKNAVIAAPSSVADAYMGQGSHPDIVERVWDKLGATLPGVSRCLVYGTPVIVHKRSGIVIAICNGTQYNLRLTESDFAKAIGKGAKTRNRWSDGGEMDALDILGPNWIFGGWYAEEAQWCCDSCAELGAVAD